MDKNPKSFRLSPDPDKDHPKRVLMIALGALLLLFIGGYMGYSWAVNNPSYALASIFQAIQRERPSSAWQTYTNKTYGYSLSYPLSWKLDTKYAEPTTTADNLMSSGSSIKLTTPEGYQLMLGYNLYGVGGSGISFYKYKNVMVNGKQYTKAYLNNCYGPAGPQGNSTPAPSTCKDYFTEIAYTETKNTNFKDMLSFTLTAFNGKTSSLVFIPFNGVGSQGIKQISVNDVAFKSTDATLDRVVASLTFPKQ